MTNNHFRFGHWNTPEPWEWLAAQKSYLIPTNSHWPLKVSRAGWHHGHWQTRGCLSEDLKGWPTALSLKRPTLDSWWVELLGLKLHFCWASQLHSAQTKDSQCFLGTTILGSITSSQLGTAQGLNNQPCGQLCLSATHQLCQFSHLLDFWWRLSELCVSIIDGTESGTS